MAASLVVGSFLLLLASCIHNEAKAQSSQGLFWLCVPVDSTHPQPLYCPVGTSAPLPVASSAASVGGASIFSSTTLTNTAVAVDASAGTVSFIHVANTGTSPALCYLQVFNVAAASVMLGTTTPTMSLAVAANVVLDLPLATPLQFSTAISVAATTTATGSTACSPILASTVIAYK